MSKFDNSIKPGEQHRLTVTFQSNRDFNNSFLNQIRSSAFVRAYPINLKSNKSKLLDSDLISENDRKNAESAQKYWQVTSDMYSKLLGDLKNKVL
jgi:hypothetical protein